MDLEIATWTRPEDMQQARPTFMAASPGQAADIMGHASAALSAVSLAFAGTDAAYSAQALAAARRLYGLATAAEGLYTASFAPNQKVHTFQHLVPDKTPSQICLHDLLHLDPATEMAPGSRHAAHQSPASM